MNLDEIITLMKKGDTDIFSPKYLAIPAELRDQNTRSKQRDYGTHSKYIADAAGFSTVNVPLHAIGHGFEARLKAYLIDAGKKQGVITNCTNTYRLVLKFAVALGQLEPAPPVYKKPARNALTRVDENGVRQVLRPKLRDPVEPYAANLDAMSSEFRQDLAKLEHFYTASIVKGRKRKANRGSTWGLNKGRILRFFGALAITGRPLNEAKLEDFIDSDRLIEYMGFFTIVNPEPTISLKDLLSLAGKVAKHYFKDAEAADAIADLIAQIKFVRVKEIDQKIQLVTADDLYHLADQLYCHAQAYRKAHFNQKPGAAIQHPKAMTAYHIGRALVVHVALATWLRKANLINMEYGKNLYYQDETLWFRFSAEEMKTGNEHCGQVRDLWRGTAALNRLKELLKDYLELRPYLVERFQKSHPGEEPPKQLFLTKQGTPFAPNGMWYLFSSLSRQYLGNEKEIYPHNVRHIIPSRLLKEHGYAVYTNIQMLLGHTSSKTTDLHYLRVKRLFSAEMVEDQIEKQKMQEQLAERVHHIESMLESNLSNVNIEELRQLLKEFKGELGRIA